MYNACSSKIDEPYPIEILQQQGYEVKRIPKNGNLKNKTLLRKGSNGKGNGTQRVQAGKCVKRLPRAIVVGIQKCGTTALVKFLGAHPEIAAFQYEAQYFFGRNYQNHPIDWYRKMMPCSFPNQITIEKSPPYFYRREAAKNIRDMNPKTKIIIIVKDPVTRAVSMYAMLKEYKKVGGKRFEDCVTYNDNKTINSSSRFIEFSNYPKHMQVWLEYFNREQILMLDGHQMELNPASELKKVERFLGIKNYFTPEMFAYNLTKKKYCLNIDPDKLDCLADKKGREHPDIDSDIRISLEQYFRPLNKRFFKMIGMSFDWSY
jgi:[heparan sulfate]-glucosamine 3-sulfotransferase 5